MDFLTQEARKISERICATVGIDLPQLSQTNVPLAVRPILEHAEILGIGDDGAREEIFQSVPQAYLDLVKVAISETNGFFAWYDNAEKSLVKKDTPEVIAIGWMLFGLNLS